MAIVVHEAESAALPMPPAAVLQPPQLAVLQTLGGGGHLRGEAVVVGGTATGLEAGQAGLIPGYTVGT